MNKDEFIQRLGKDVFGLISDDEESRAPIERTLMGSVGRPATASLAETAGEKGVAMSSRPHPMDEFDAEEELGEGDVLSSAEELRQFDQAVQKRLGISGEEFIRRWESGEYWGIADEPDHLHIGSLISLIPFARQNA
ncbi:MAG: hypothetical protein ACR2OO_16315 [Thermomicrobiales bacterium]